MTADIKLVPAGPSPSAAMQRDYRGTLVAPLDDMWAAFAEMAQPFTILLEGESIGFFSLNEKSELHRFYICPAFEHRADEVLQHVVAERSICAAFPSTVDPAFLSLCMDRAQGVEVKALMFQHVVDPGPVENPLQTMRLADKSDFEATVAFERAAIGAPLAFLQPYLTARIDAGELRLHEVEGAIVGVGELRPDATKPGYAHLGMIVGEAQRGRGLGSAIMRYLVEEAGRQKLTAICSTEPTNPGARRVIERTGFRARHRVLRVAFSS